MLQQLERFDEAEISYGQAIALKPDYAEAHNNLGATLKQMGRLEEAMSTITKAIELNPHLPESRKNLVELLTSYAPQEEVSHPIVKVNQEIKKNYLNEKTSGIISDDKIIQLFDKSTSIIKRCDLKIETDLSQVYRSNSINLNCNRHMKVFNKHNIIPKFCFGCYKVLVEPRSILELIKLFVVFDQIKLVENNIRKCMIEMRPKISGFYKGYIFCSSVEEAYQMADYLEIFVKENIGSGLHAVVKRGCSEYPLSFPDYKAINKSGGQLMNYNEDWKSIEEDYDSLNSIKSSKIITPHLSGLNLQDVLIIRNWIDYAKGIGDPSAHLLNQNTVFSPKIYKTAKTRIEKYPW
jgi:tetratricopeptide (TPR) repeat protein